MDKKDILKKVDHTLLGQTATWDDIRGILDDAMKYEAASACIPAAYVKQAAEYVAGKLPICTVIGFPNGYNTTAVKVFETKDAIANGANEIDYVVNQTEIKASNWDYIKDEMSQIVAACHEKDVTCKVIFENCYLNDEEKIKLCEIAKEVKPDFIKTSTGFGTGGATFDDVKLMKEHVGDAVKVKAAGGIRDAKTFMKMIECGAQRIGTSAGISIIKEFEAMMKEQGVSTLEI